MAKKVDTNKIHKCYYCGKEIESLNDLVVKKFPMATKNGVRQFNRKLHMSCLLKYNEEVTDHDLKKAEYSDWDKLYRYFRKEILGLDESINLDEHTIKRLLGLRLGQFYPSGNNTMILKRGYEFSTILIACKVCKLKIKNYLSKANLKDNKHRTNGIMKIIASEINDVQIRIDNQNKSNQRLEEYDVVDSTKTTLDYVELLKLQKQKQQEEEEKKENNSNVNSNIQKLFGGQL